ncbi:MAG: ethylbenzene dehydrogenase-related protein [Candidatus Methanoperedens sp.]|uniref:ethylbenzene dehydrogenase-related protein n=1 Tax=Candidatus Methanoperedens sp. BLZ2 TaxID=2035255 RepID=UPI000BE2A1F8|nr:ethylbenzene dehydrogenase-related protein [Candidatus Methanoperedens sp. BLZ2]KAB2946921.1 MAG: hypothetical protein F9K14_05640 [Candidatus Methanoperedens sp.]MBZ0176717.1 hypothetical protein [Candidatus Methanoperedens nitroreducens]MCX9080439.1 ethylbenzene dehydrogenase-related protein [Candidatus Methanoperedens sp.]
MKKNNVILIIIVAISSVALAYCGLGVSSGILAATQAHQMPIEVQFIDKDIDLEKGIFPEIWEPIHPIDIEMEYQVMVLPWGKSLINPVTVKSFHNGKEIYFYMSWKDDTEDRIIGTSRFSDAAAIMFPIGNNVQNSTIMMGFMGNGSNIWQWKASQDNEYWLNETSKIEAYSDYYYPFEDNETLAVSKAAPGSAVNDLMVIRVGTLTPKPAQNVQGRGIWDNGTWQVVFKRSLDIADPEQDADFNTLTRVAFAVWNGANGDRGGRKSIAHDWTALDIIPVGGTK